MRFFQAFTLLLAQAQVVSAVQCGQWYSTDCLADTDIRYDKDASDAFFDQNPIWEKFNGFWNFTELTYDVFGAPSSAGLFDLELGFWGPGLPYNLFPSTGYVNVTITGSRFAQHNLWIYQPASEEFCSQEVPEGFANVVGNGTCGINGYSQAVEYFATTSYERDGSANMFPVSTGLSFDPDKFEGDSHEILPVDER